MWAASKTLNELVMMDGILFFGVLRGALTKSQSDGFGACSRIDQGFDTSDLGFVSLSFNYLFPFPEQPCEFYRSFPLYIQLSQSCTIRSLFSTVKMLFGMTFPSSTH
jgi:hypothetical protein